MLPIDERRAIPEEELAYAASRASGPGGQNVNKVETRVTVLFDLEASRALSPEEKRRIKERLATRITKAGILRVTSQRHRTQAANRAEARARLAALVRTAVAERPRRRPTRPPAGAGRRRLEAKRQHGETKRRRGRVREEV